MENATLHLDDGTTRAVTISWGTIDTSQVGVQTVTSSNYTIPAGVATTNKPSASITVNVTEA